MKILQVGTGFALMPPAGAYATERTIHSLSSALVSLGHKIMVLDIEEKNRLSVPYGVIEVPLRWRKDINLPTHILRGFAFRQASGQALRTLLKSEHFDIINFHNQFSAQHISLAHHHGIPAVYSLHNAIWYKSSACRSSWQRLKFFQDVVAMRRADMVICQNNTTASNLACYLGIPQTKIAVIHLGIEDSWLADTKVSEVMQSQYTPNDEPIVLNVARIAPYKNQLTLAKAIPLVVREVPNVRFLFVGPVFDKGYARRLHQTISKAGVAKNVTFLGEVPYADLPQLYSLCEVFVIPSESEAFGVVVLEAMASGKATVASDIETFQEMLRGSRGVTVPAFDHRALADAIISLLKDDTFRQTIGQRAKEHVKHNFTWNNVARRTVQVYEDVVKW